MKIILVIPTFAKGGAERVVSRLSLYWESIGHEVRVIVFDGSNPQYSYGGTTHDCRSRASLWTVVKIRNIILRTLVIKKIIVSFKPDKIISFMETANFPCLFAWLISKSMGDITVSIRSSPVLFGHFTRFMVKRLYKKATKIVVQTRGAKNFAIKNLNLPNNKVRIVPNPISNEFFERPHSCDRRRRSILAVGRLERVKGFDLLIKACSLLSGIHLRIIGDGSERLNLLMLVNELGLSGCVTLPGQFEDIIPQLDSAAIFVLPSRNEGYPNALAEAMARGCGVVAFDCKYGPSEMIDSGDNGILVPPGDPVSLADAISTILSNDSLWISFGDRARVKSREWDIKMISIQWLN